MARTRARSRWRSAPCRGSKRCRGGIHAARDPHPHQCRGGIHAARDPHPHQCRGGIHAARDPHPHQCRGGIHAARCSHPAPMPGPACRAVPRPRGGWSPMRTPPADRRAVGEPFRARGYFSLARWRGGFPSSGLTHMRALATLTTVRRSIPVTPTWTQWLVGSALAIGAAVAGTAGGAAAQGSAAAVSPAGHRATAVFSGGCFWGVQAVFEHVRGVLSAESGYTGGAARTAEYEIVSTGSTGHAESVRVTFDPTQVTYAQLLDVFFTIAHDPTEKNRQGPDEGTQYRSAVWYATPEQKATAESVIQQLTAAHVFRSPIVTEVSPLGGFYPAESYHQDYYIHHPDAAYIVINDKPKVEHLERARPALYRDTPVLYAAESTAR